MVTHVSQILLLGISNLERVSTRLAVTSVAKANQLFSFV